MYDTHTDLLDALRAWPAILETLIQGYTAETARDGRTGDWSAIEIVCHLRDAEERALERMRMMRDQENPFIHGYDQEAWARERGHANADLAEAFPAFTRFREQHTSELAALAPEEWDRTGQHEEVGRITILDHTIRVVSHDVIHGEQLARRREIHVP